MLIPKMTSFPTRTMSMLSEFTLDDLQLLSDMNPKFRGYLHGYLSELKLMRYLEKIPGISSVKKIPDNDSRKGDFEIIYEGMVKTIECKGMIQSSIKEDHMNESWVGEVNLKTTSKRKLTLNSVELDSHALPKGEFDILAVGCYAVTGEWDFLFIETKYLLEAPHTPGLIKHHIKVEPFQTAGLTSNLEGLLQKMKNQSSAYTC